MPSPDLYFACAAQLRSRGAVTGKGHDKLVIQCRRMPSVD